MQLSNRFRVPVDQQGCIATLQSNREALEKVFYFERSFFSPAASVLTGHFLQKFGRILVPSAESFDDQWLEEDALGSAVVQVSAAFGRLAQYYSSSKFYR